MPDRLRPPLVLPSRRRFLAGGVALSFLAACGDSSSTTTAGTDPGSSDPETTDGDNPLLSVVQFYGPYFVVGRTNRVPFGIADEDGLLSIAAAPDDVSVTVKAPDGTVLADAVPAAKHSEGLPRPYYRFEFEPSAPGFYDYTVRSGTEEIISQVQVVAPDDEAVTGLVGPGDQMPSVATPTKENPLGVDPICTRNPPCDLHGVSLDQALGTGPVALLVSTPAFCQTAICGPVLDAMIAQMDRYPGVTFIHAEVYKNPTDSASVLEADFAPIIGQLGLEFEPALFTVSVDGMVQDRLDYIFDGAEVDTVLGRLGG